MKINNVFLILITWILLCVSCVTTIRASEVKQKKSLDNIKTIHVLVALCDNQYQRIVPVPAKIGNGDDLLNNLYWGAAYGVKNYFSKSKQWQLIASIKDPKAGIILERVVFKNISSNTYLVADAYRGREIEKCTVDLLEFASGKGKSEIEIFDKNKKIKLNIGGQANLISYIGHNGLMDFQLKEYPKQVTQNKRDIVILACASKNYFQNAILTSGANPILWTTNFMAPEAYILEAAINSWLNNESLETLRLKAAQAYNKYQKCGIKGALRLFSSSW
ncbi:MAG: hypothetical protein WAQ98_06670 [Blastocatellia bacterium]